MTFASAPHQLPGHFPIVDLLLTQDPLLTKNGIYTQSLPAVCFSPMNSFVGQLLKTVSSMIVYHQLTGALLTELQSRRDNTLACLLSGCLFIFLLVHFRIT